MSSDPHDQLLLQIRGAVAEYERTLIAERMRRGRLAKMRAGALLPWTRPPFGYRLDPERPRDAAAVRVEAGEAVLVAQLFDWYLQPQATVYQLARRLTDLGVVTPTGKPRWNVASVRWILRNPAYTGRALTNRTQVAPARARKSAMLPAGPGLSHAPRPPEDWIEVPVPQIVSEETFAQVQAKLDANQQGAARNTRHQYLLRALVSCGACRLSCTGRQTAKGYRYYLCRGRTDALRAAQGQRCTARYIPAGQLDELVWADLCALLTDPAQVARALDRARGGAWLPQELQARQAAIRQALGQLDHQRQRLLDAYLAGVIGIDELQRKRQELDRRHAALLAQQRQLEAAAGQRLELQAVASGIERFCRTVRAGLATATFTQRRQLAELLIDRVVVTGGRVEIRYVLPTSPDGPHRPFCQLRKDHLDFPALVVAGGEFGGRCGGGVGQGGDQPVVLGPGRGAISGGVQVELDDPDRDACGRAGQRPAAVAGPGGPPAGRRLGQHRPVGPIRQDLQRRQPLGGLDPDQHVRPGGGERGGHRVAAEGPVGHRQHPRAQPPAPGDLAGQVLLAAPQPRPERRIRDPAAPAPGQRDQPHLRERAPRRRRAERGHISGRGRHLHGGTIQRHHQPPEGPRPRRPRPRQRPGQPGKQHPERRHPHPPPGPGQRRGPRHPPPPRPGQPPQPPRQLARHLPITLSREQAQPQHEHHHRHRRQQPPPPLPRPRRRHRLLHQPQRQAHPLRQPARTRHDTNGTISTQQSSCPRTSDLGRRCPTRSFVALHHDTPSTPPDAHQPPRRQQTLKYAALVATGAERSRCCRRRLTRCACCA